MYTFWTRYALVNDLCINIVLNNYTSLYNTNAIQSMEDYDIYKYLNVLSHSQYKNTFREEDIFMFELAYNKEL